MKNDSLKKNKPGRAEEGTPSINGTRRECEEEVKRN